MEIAWPEYMPDPGMTREEMEELQREIAAEAVFHNDFKARDVVAGVDQAFLGDKIVSGAVVMKDGEVIERKNVVQDVDFPYIPGLLAFREAPAIAAVLQRLENEPNYLMLDGNGRIHYREAGIATHIGVLFNFPAVGVAKNLLCGELERDTDKLGEGEKVEIRTGEEFEYDALLGYAYQSKQFDSYRINPVYVSPGHRIGAETAVELVEEHCKDYKLPEPVRLADQYVDEVKKEYT